MRRLRSSDPARIADHRLLGRLGAGGMGLVYLARTPGGSLVALKVLAAEYAEDRGFRDRFRREVEVARRISSPWAVPLVDADADAESPWLATAYVPGPSLAEAVAAHGPLGERGLRVLGGRLAQALGEVHRAGLVHRDLKPGNVLLAADGPRLIDFGITRAPEDTALTATGLVVGTPGYLAPEQADGRDARTIGPASDIFSLGCVLAYAATGRPPFGEGPLDALLFRAVHDPADLDDAPAPLTDLLSRCLEKDPTRRPGTGEVVRELLPEESGDDAPAVAPGGAPEPWLPEDVVRLIARRSSEALALPDIEHTEISADGSSVGAEPDGSADGTGARGSGSSEAGPHVREPDAAVPVSGADDALPTATATDSDKPVRRRALLLAGAGALLVGGGGAVWWAVGRGDGTGGGKPSVAASSGRPTHTIALHGDLSGTARVTGRAQERGLRLAVAEFNERKDAPFQVRVRAVDDGGDPAEAARLAKELAEDKSVLAVVGPTTDASAQTALAAYDAALLPVVSVSTGGINLSVQGFRSFLNARLSDTILAIYLDAVVRGGRPSRVGLVVDRASDTYGSEIGTTLSRQLHTAAQPYVPRVVSAMRSGFDDAVDDLLAAGTDAFAFAGLHDRGVSFARALSERGFSGARASGPALLDERFLTEAKEAAEGWSIVAPVVDATRVDGARAFVDAYRERWKEAPPRYAAEAYDMTGMVLTTLAGLSARSRTREELLAALFAAKYQGVTRSYGFQKTGLPVIDGTGGHLWRVENGTFVYDGPAPLQA
ncbi:bifunctional serine/threonine-protein kinase/ABC transporter substrate-binding protein [Streptomyces sp. NPDC002643]